jgi:hypothetical protein
MRASPQGSSSHGGNAATGLLFVGIVMVVLFGGGIGAVLATGSDPPPPTLRDTAARVNARVAADQHGGKAAGQAGARLAELVRLRDTALGRRDVTLLDRVYAPGCAHRRFDRASIAQLRRQRARWLGLATSVQVLEASRADARRWTLLASVTSAPARLVTEAGRQLTTRPAARRLLRFTLVLPPGGRDWVVLGIAPARPAG